MLFASVDSVLRWAYAMEGVSVCPQAKIFEGKLRRRTRLWDGWTTWERHAQAALVRGQVERLGDPLGAYGVACYAPVDRRFPAAQALLRWLGPPVHHASAYELMVEQYVLGSSGRGSGGIGAVRRHLHCRKTTALAERARVFERLDGLRAQLFVRLEPMLIEGELIPRREGAPMIPVITRLEACVAA
jgi:hypothetical protein